jgi:hypothetical protein
MGEGAPKSALEIALERLRQQDAAEGIVERPLTDEQRAAIAEARSVCEARLAELKIMHEAKMARTWDPEARALAEEEYRRDVERVTAERDRKIAAIRERSQPA